MKWIINYGMGGGFGGETEHAIVEDVTHKEALEAAFKAACENYEQYEGFYGIRTRTEIIEDGDCEAEEVEDYWNDERESWIEYSITPYSDELALEYDLMAENFTDEEWERLLNDSINSSSDAAITYTTITNAINRCGEQSDTYKNMWYDNLSLDDIQTTWNNYSSRKIDFADPAHRELLEESILHDFINYHIVDGYIKWKDYSPVNVPFECRSGKIVVSDFLRNIKESDVEYNLTGKNRRETMALYGEYKILYGFIGNSCPKIYQHNITGNIHIGATTNDGTPDDENLKRVGSILTDLWQYCIMDADEYENRFGAIKAGSGEDVIEIGKGEWILEHYYGCIDGQSHPNREYAKLIKL